MRVRAFDRIRPPISTKRLSLSLSNSLQLSHIHEIQTETNHKHKIRSFIATPTSTFSSHFVSTLCESPPKPPPPSPPKEKRKSTLLVIGRIHKRNSSPIPVPTKQNYKDTHKFNSWCSRKIPSSPKTYNFLSTSSSSSPTNTQLKKYYYIPVWTIHSPFKKINWLIDWRGQKKTKTKRRITPSSSAMHRIPESQPSKFLGSYLEGRNQSIPAPIKTIFIATNKVLPYKLRNSFFWDQ